MFGRAYSPYFLSQPKGRGFSYFARLFFFGRDIVILYQNKEHRHRSVQNLKDLRLHYDVLPKNST